MRDIDETGTFVEQVAERWFRFAGKRVRITGSLVDTGVRVALAGPDSLEGNVFAAVNPVPAATLRCWGEACVTIEADVVQDGGFVEGATILDGPPIHLSGVEVVGLSRGCKPLHVSTSFDTDAARAQMRAIVVASVGCRRDGGPVGRVHMVVAFPEDGGEVRATVDEAPFAGTDEATCIERVATQAHVPPFHVYGTPLSLPVTFFLGDASVPGAR